MGLTREQMLERMMASDAAYDGRFITGVHSTGIYCLPSCRARKPKPENVRFYTTEIEAREAGLRPCKKCRPDERLAGLNPDLDRLMSAWSAVRSQPGQFKSVEDVAREAAVSPTSLYTAVREHFRSTPGVLLATARIERARSLLLEGMPPAEVGLDVGYDSTSAFYDNFGRLNGMPPAAYARLRNERDFECELPHGLHLEGFLRHLGRDAESHSELVHSGAFSIATLIDGRASRIDARICGTRLNVSVTESGAVVESHRRLTRALGFDQDPRAFEEQMETSGLGRLVGNRRGSRLPQTLTRFDGIVWSIVGQQVNLGFAYALRNRLTQLAGIPVGDGMIAPPDPARVAELQIDQLLPLQFSRRKAEYLIGIAREIVDGRLDLDRLAEEPQDRVEAALTGLRGIGPWSANYVMMRSLGMPDCVPLGDTGLTSALARFFDVARPGREETLALMDRFRPFRSLATYHLWQSLGDEQ